ncbi:hypothetical protein PIB30_095189, partial [Stylosanthes scabra]|nr:hypothetical protein [Stylosanthes scabra]
KGEDEREMTTAPVKGRVVTAVAGDTEERDRLREREIAKRERVGHGLKGGSRRRFSPSPKLP